MKKICIFVGSRANYSSIKSAMIAIKEHPELELQLITGASAILDKYGSVVELIEKDGFPSMAKADMLMENDTPEAMAKSTGLGIIELSTIFSQIKPDVVVTIGDRFETMATTLAAAYMNIAVAHTMGGEVTGTIDESIRHAVTKFAHIHFPANEGARNRIIKLGEDSDHVHLVGCPRIDLVDALLKEDWDFDQDTFGETPGSILDFEKPFIIMSQHPVTSEYGDAEDQVEHTLNALCQIIEEQTMQAVVLWPNPDAGSDDVSRAIRKLRERKLDLNMHFFKNLPIKDYVFLMSKTACLVGNSSSGIREGAFIGTPVVNIGSRQAGRDRGKNVIDVGYDLESIYAAITKQLEHGKYAPDHIYGDGRAGKKIADILANTTLKTVQKRITY